MELLEFKYLTNKITNKKVFVLVSDGGGGGKSDNFPPALRCFCMAVIK